MLGQLEARGVSEVAAAHMVASLIETSLRGIDSHGINLFSHYCAAAQSGRINLDPKLKITATSQSLAILDADWTYGHHAGAFAMDYAQKVAAETGIGLVNVVNSSHFGSAAYFALRAARSDFLAFAFTNADSLVKAHNAAESFFGTNPICFAAPMNNEDPLCLDMATSAVSWNKIKNYRRESRPLDPGWAFDKDGLPVTDPHAAVSLAPSGSYKGFGLGLMVEVLCSMLTGAPIGRDLAPMYENIAQRRNISHSFIALDISRIRGVGHFKSQLTEMAVRIRMMRKLGVENVMVPGDPEKKAFYHRVSSGIPVSEAVHENLRVLHPTIDSVINLSLEL